MNPFESSGALSSASPSTLATALLFGTLTFTYTSLAARTWLAGDSRPLTSVLKTLGHKSHPLDISNFVSVFLLLHQASVFGGVLLFAYICEYHPPFPHGEKGYDRDQFFFVIAVFFVCAGFTVKRNGGGGGMGGKMPPVKGGSVVSGQTKLSSVNIQQDYEEVDEDDGGSVDSDSSASSASSSSLSVSRRMVPVPPVPPCDDILNREQTEEWKGWMQFVFLLYHYYHAEEVYNSIRVMITCYVWMTGFGNFSYFYTKDDYSIARVLQMLWRLNFLVVFLCLSQGTTYILYYICPLHTYFFLMVYASMRIGRDLNYTKMGLRVKLLVVGVVIFLVWDVDSGLFRLFHFLFLSDEPTIGAKMGTLWEWYFRSFLDHWSAYLGMVFALNYPIVSLWFRKLEVLPSGRQQWLAKGVVGTALFMAFYIWLSGPFRQAKFVYNGTNPFFGFIPLLTYVYFRNLTPSLRQYSLDLFQTVGKTTLETYLMQHHIWLTSDAKTLLVLIPGYPKLNTILVTVIYFNVSRRLYRITLYLRGMFLPDDKQFCFRSLTGIFATILLFYLVALSLTVMNLTNLATIGIVSALCGLCLYQFIMDTTWNSFRQSAPPMTTGPDSFLDAFMRTQHSVQNKYRTQQQRHTLATSKQTQQQHQHTLNPPESLIARLSPPLIGTLFLLILGLILHGASTTGASKITPLPSHCEQRANTGAWIPVDPCSAVDVGHARRHRGVAQTVCTPADVYTWGWNITDSASQCRFSHRGVSTVKTHLRGRRLLFVGDSITRNIYHAVLRSAGVRSGYHDATVAKHSDIDFTFDKEDITVEFKWAPLAVDQLQFFKEFSSRASSGADGRLPDVIITGGGAWDRLHVYATDEDQSSLKTTVKELVKQFRSATVDKGVPVVWTIPTVIHTEALTHEEKRDHMKESDMEEMRTLYNSLGVLTTSSFVLDGPAFTRDRVEESYDGVHYPPAVYDGGAQILLNAFDWVLPPLSEEDQESQQDSSSFPHPGKMANLYLGTMMLCFIFIGLMFFDGFVGFSYLAGLVVKGVAPADLYEEAFGVLHRQLNLPPIQMDGSAAAAMMPLVNSVGAGAAAGPSGNLMTEDTNLKGVDDEIASLLSGSPNSGGLLEMGSGNAGPSRAVRVEYDD